MSDIESESISWLWKPYIPQGKITIVQGDPGDGKTTMMLAIAAAITKGEALPNGGASSPADVLFQTAEDGLADTIKPRLEDLGADCYRIHVIDENEKSLSLSDERIEKAIVKTRAKLLILDPLQAYLGGSDFNSAHGVRPLMKTLAGVAERTGCAIVIIGHLNKGRGKSQYRGLGSIDIYAAARSVLTVGRLSDGENENLRAVVQGKSNLAPPGVSMMFELDLVLGFVWRGEVNADIDDVMAGRKKPESQFDKAKRIILSFLSDGYEVAANEIIGQAEDDGVSLITLKRAKAELGVISNRRGGQWFWQLPIDVKFAENQEYQEEHRTLMIPLKTEVV